MLLVNLKDRLFAKVTGIFIKKMVKEYIGDKSDIYVDNLVISNDDKGLTFEAKISGVIVEEELMNLIKKALD